MKWNQIRLRRKKRYLEHYKRLILTINSKPEQYALNEASFVIARFLQKYERIVAVDMNGKLDKKLSLTMSPHEVKIRFYPAL